MIIFVAIFLVILVFIIFQIKEKNDTIFFQKTNKDIFDNAVFPSYEAFFKPAISTYADDLKIRRILGSDVNSFRITPVLHKFTSFYAVMYFKAICDNVGKEEELNNKYSQKLSKCAESDICDKYQKYYNAFFPKNDFVKTKLKRMSDNELIIAFAIPRDCIFDFNNETIF